MTIERSNELERLEKKYIAPILKVLKGINCADAKYVLKMSIEEIEKRQRKLIL